MSTERGPFSWVSRKRNYKNEEKNLLKIAEPCNQHPLKPNTVVEANKKSKDHSNSSTQPAFIDPLNQASSFDSLSKMVADVSFKEKQEKLKQSEMASSFEPWSLKKSSILSKYTTIEKLSITSSFLTPIAGSMKDKAAVTQTDKIKNRLEQLDQFDNDDNLQEMSNLSQQEYIKRIDELNNALLAAWAEDDRVKSLKIVIQCSKLLADSSVIQFYPSKFVLITDILDSFGRLVYERIKQKSLYIAPGSAKPQPLPENFTSDIVPATAKETCRNWFFKIASIRELLPRIYVEASILKCTSFISDDSISKPISRLISMCAGVGDPLVAAFANCYICRVGVSIDTSIREHQSLAFANLLVMFKQINSDKVRKLTQNQKIDNKTYLELYCPAIDWILQCLCYARSSDYLKEVLEKCVLVSNENKIVNGLLINSMMTSFEPAFLSLIAEKLIELITLCDDEYFPKHLLFRNLGLCLIMNTNSSAKYELVLLNGVWKTVTKFNDPSNYISCAEIWVEFTLKYFTKKEINTLLGDIIKHIQQDRVFENYYPQLQSIVSKILVYITDFSILFSMDKFMQFFNLFQKESVKLEVCKSITYGFLRAEKNFNEDIVVINSMMQICKSMHDYVNALTLDDEKREISQMICAFLNKIEMVEKDKIEQYLNFYSDARASFSNLDNVISLLVHKVNNLSMETLNAVKGQHTRKTAAFVRACTAFSFISIPSLTNPTLKLQLYLESAHVALQNQCHSQCDAHLKSAISLVAEMHKQAPDPSHTSQCEKYLNDFLSNMMSTLLAVPDNPEQGVLYLLTGCLNLVQKHLTWENVECKFNLLLNGLVILSALKQEAHLYGVSDVEANDTLYASDIKYLREINSMIDSIGNDLFGIIQSQSGLKQSQMALDLLNRLIAHGDITDPKVSLHIVEMWNISSKYSQNGKYQENIANALKVRSLKGERSEDYKSILNKLNLK